MRDARTDPRVRLEERLHAVAIAREDHDEVVAVVLHHLQQDLDRLLAVVALVLRSIEVIRLVDEQHAAHRALQHLAGPRRRVPDVLADEVVARHGHEVSFADVAEAVQDLGHPQRDRGLAGAGIAGERHVQARRLGLQPEVRAQTVHDQQRRDVADARLDRRETDEVAVEFVHDRACLALRQHLADAARAGEQVISRRQRQRSAWNGVRGSAHAVLALLAVALAFGTLSRKPTHAVAHRAAVRVLPHESEARLDGRAGSR